MCWLASSGFSKLLWPAATALMVAVVDAVAPLDALQGDTTSALVEYRRAEKMTHNGRRNQAPQLAQAAIHFHSGRLSEAMNM
jgi:Mg-chelatase subunit ChlI